MLIATQSAREFRDAIRRTPTPRRILRAQFRRTERLVIRVPAYAAGAPVAVTARLLNRLGAADARIWSRCPSATASTQFDLPLAPLAPGEYFLQFSVAGPSGPVDQRIAFRITG